MRMTTAMMANRSVYAINNSYRLMNKYQTQLETQTKISRPSDDPVVAMKGVKNRTELSGVNQYIRNNTEANTWIEATDTAYDEAKSLIQRMRELADNLANGTNSEEDRKTAAEEIKQIKKQMLEIANTQIGGQYIFSGTDIHTKPFVENADGTVTHQKGAGAEGAVHVEVSRVDDIKTMMAVNSLPSAFFVPNHSAGATVTFQAGGISVAGTLDVTVNNQKFSVELTTDDDTLNELANKINQAAVTSGLEPLAKVNGDKIEMTSYTNDPNGGGLEVKFDPDKVTKVALPSTNDTGVTVNGTLKVTVAGQAQAIDVQLNTNDHNTPDKIVKAINEAAGTNGPLAKVNSKGQVVIAAPDGSAIKVEFSGGLTINGTQQQDITNNNLIGGNIPAPTAHPYDPDPAKNQPGLKRKSVFEEIDAFVALAEGKGNLSDMDVSIGLSHWLCTADQMLERANLAMAEVGGKQNRLDLVSSRNEATHIFVNKMLSENEDIDIEEVIVNLSMQETMHRASLAVSAKIIQPSLIDFLS